MKRVVFSLRSIIGAFLGAILGLLGFSACKSQKAGKVEQPSIEAEHERQLIAMYGTPNTMFRVIDTVTITEDSIPAEQHPDQQTDTQD